jgi:hypothetical protein
VDHPVSGFMAEAVLREADPDRTGAAIVIVEEINGVMDGKILQKRALP